MGDNKQIVEENLCMSEKITTFAPVFDFRPLSNSKTVMKIAFSTLGCKLNFAESSAIGKALLSAGHTRAKQGEEADAVILNTCSVTDAADHKGRQAIHRLRRQHPRAMLIVTGCYAELKGDEIQSMPEVDYVFGANEKEKIVRLLTDNQTDAAPAAENGAKVPAFFPACSRDDRTRCFLKVQDGCNYFCTYCTIPLARGRSRNAPIADIVAQARQALQEGAKEIVLTGVNIGDFGRTTGERFIDLLRALDDLQDASPCGEYRMRISSCEPNLLTDEIIDWVAESRHFAPHFHIPLQSGSNEVLKIMHRHYDRELFAERVAHIRQRMPNAFIGVDCMVGVRGETEERWNDYLEFVKSLSVSQLHVFTYSERANTRMPEMDLYVVPKQERERRSKILHEVSEQKLHAFYQAHQGDEAVVLWEAKRVGDCMEGFTENYIRLSTPYDKTKINTFEKLHINLSL